MAKTSQLSIASRFGKLNHLIIGKASLGISNHHLINRDGLLDSLFSLYEECNTDYMRKNKHIATFVDKYRGVITELRSLRVKIDDFEVEKTIGRGQFGEVKLVREKVTGHIYAMKILNKNDTLSQQNAFYEEERDIMAKARSKWITHLQYAFQDKMSLYFVMEFHPGGDMLSLLEHYNSILEEDMARFYLAELVLAINSVHSMGYVHRDIKPDNILLDRLGHIKLADFGSSSKLGPQKTVTSRMPAGTPDYIAPEVLMSLSDGNIAYGVECDWWSLGVVAYEMMLGSTPFSHEKLTETYNSIMNFKDSVHLLKNTDGLLSQLALDLIRNLLQEAPQRLGYDQLRKHDFFADINWNSIHKTSPPYIPEVASQDDTSNFADFDPDPNRFKLALEHKKEFSGNNLPFVGFTYTSIWNCASESRASASFDVGDGNLISTSIISPDDDSTSKKEVAYLQQKIELLGQNGITLKKKIQELQTSLEEKETQCSSLQNERDSLKSSYEEANLKILVLKERLSSEAQNFVKVEEKTKEMILAIKKQYENKLKLVKKVESPTKKSMKEKLCLEKTLAEVNAEVDKYKEDMIKLTNELLSTKKLLLSCSRHKEVEAERATLHDHFEEDQKKMNIEFELLKKEKNNADNQVESLKNVILKLEAEMSNTKTDVLKGSGEIINSEVEAVRVKLQNKFEEDQKKMNIEFELLKKEKNNADKQIESLKNVILKLEAEMSNTKADALKGSGEIINLEDEAKQLKKKLDSMSQELESNKKDFNGQILKKDEQIEVLQKMISQLENDLKINAEEILRNKKAMQEQENELTNKISQLQSALTNLTEENKQIQQEKEELKTENISLNQKIKEWAEQEMKNHKPEPSPESRLLEMKIEKLEAEKDKLKERWLDLVQKKKEKEAEFSQLSLDLRLARHEVKQAEDIVGTLRESNSNLREKVSALENSLLEKNNDEKILNEKIRHLELDIQQLRHTAESVEEKQERIQCLVREQKKLEEKLKDKDKQCDVLERNLKIIKDACTEQDKQMKQLEDLVEILQEKLSNSNIYKESLKKEIDEVEKDIRAMQESLAKEKRMRVESEQQVLELREEMGIQETCFDSQCKLLHEQLDQEKESVMDLSQQNIASQRQVAQLTSENELLEKRNLFLKEELVQIKEEAARHITQIASLKDSNLQLTQSLDEALEKMNEQQSTIEDLQSDYETAEASYEHEKLKLQQTIKQQTKLIDFLQTKVEKKKKGVQWWFGRSKEDKENLGPTSHIKDLQSMLEKERYKSRRLQEQVNSMELFDKISHSQPVQGQPSIIPVSPASRAVHTALALSPSSTSNSQTLLSPGLVSKDVFSNYQKPKGERMKHNIPHRFQDILCMRGTKCVCCLDSIHFGRHASKCQECGVICHSKCATSLPRTCGVPTGYIQHFTNILQNSSHIEAPSLPHDSDAKGWVKVPRSGKPGWETRYSCLLDSTLYFFSEEVSQEKDLCRAVDKIELQLSDGEVIVTSAVSPSELMGTAQSDLPYVFKIETLPQTTCWPQRCLYVMATSFPDKQMWVSALESVISKSSTYSLSDSTPYCSTVLKLESPETLDINCCCELNERMLLVGAMEGLYVVDQFESSTDSKKHITGIKDIYQIAVLKEINQVIMISGENRELKAFTLSDLELFAQGQEENCLVEPANIAEINSCHLFAAQSIKNAEAPYLCAATSDKLICLRWNSTMNAFCIRKEIQTREPCSCFQFSKDTVIFGADKFYEMELKNYTVEDFLDASDTSLAFLIYGASQLCSFPIAIFQISQTSQQEEYVLCFHEFGVFVDCLGQRTRQDDMKWTGLPLAFAHQHPYLFVVHFHSLEVIEIVAQESQTSGYHSVMNVSNPRYLGPASNGAIYLSSSYDKSVKLIYICGKRRNIPTGHKEGDSDTLESDSLPKDRSSGGGSEGSGAGEFSFTTSLMQTLECPDLSLSMQSPTDVESNITL